MIQPTVGRVVHFFPHGPDSIMQAAIIAGVVDDRTVHIMAIHQNGAPYGRQDVRLLQDDDAAEKGHKPFCAWMDYQKGQAAKTDSLSESFHKRIADLEQMLHRLAKPTEPSGN